MATKTKPPEVYPGFLHLPNVMTVHEDFIDLSGTAIKLLIGIARQYNGKNNGDLCATWSMMRHRINSKRGLQKATEELIAKGWIEKTKQGGRQSPSLFAITWQRINYCRGKLDVSETMNPSRSFKE